MGGIASVWAGQPPCGRYRWTKLGHVIHSSVFNHLRKRFVEQVKLDITTNTESEREKANEIPLPPAILG